MEVDFLNGNRVNRRLRLAEQLKGASRPLFHRVLDRCSLNDFEDDRQRSVRRVLVAVLRRICRMSIVRRMRVVLIRSVRVALVRIVRVVMAVVLMALMRVAIVFMLTPMFVLGPGSPGPLVSWSLLLGQHVHFHRRQPAAAHFAHLQARAHVQRGRRLGEQVERHARIHQRAQQHVSADPGKALQIADFHRFVILNCFRPKKGIERATRPVAPAPRRAESRSLSLIGIPCSRA
jgi:hypothetical protein